MFVEHVQVQDCFDLLLFWIHVMSLGNYILLLLINYLLQ